MRGWTVIVATLALATGCLGNTNEDEGPIQAAGVDEGGETGPSARAAAEAPAPVTIEGTLWLPPTQGEERTESIVELPVATDGQRVRAALHLGSWYVAAEVPPLLTDVVVELRDPSGEILAEGSLTMGSPDATLEATSGAGTAILAILSYGGSDGSANGDHVDYVVEIA